MSVKTEHYDVIRKPLITEKSTMAVSYTHLRAHET